MEAVFETKPLLGPEQAKAMQEDMKAAQVTLANPMNDPRVDKGAVQRQLNRLRTDFERQVAKAPENPLEEDRMVKRANQLLSELLADGPCSMEEMRKAPPGAVEKHRRWEARNKLKLLEWKNLQKRLHVGGTVGPESWNFEAHRPATSSLNMDTALIPGRQFFMPEVTGKVTTFSDEQIETLRSYDPKLADMLGTLNNEQRQTVKELISEAKGIGLEPDPVRSAAGKAGMKKKREMGAAQKAALAQGRATAAANRAANKAPE